MSKLASSMVSEAVGATVFAGIDVSAATLAVAVQQQQGDGCRQKEFANSATGHRQLIAWLRKLGGLVRVSLEATGTYSLDVALALDAAEGIEVAVLNPKTVNRFAQTLRRSKTDAADTAALAEYSRRMEFVAGLAPEMTVRQWVAHSGLDPVHQVSGSSVRKQTRISRHGNSHLRRALYIPALVGARHDPHMRAFYELLQTRHKTKLQALVAVARKLLHAIFGIFKTGSDYSGAKLFPHLILTS